MAVELSELMRLKASASKDSKMRKLGELSKFPFPYKDITSKKNTFAIARAFSLTRGESKHTVVLAVRPGEKPDGPKDWSIWCGDTFLDGKDASAESRCREACEGLDSAGTTAAEMLRNFSAFEESGPCAFWGMWKSKKGRKLCAHTQHVLTDFSKADADDMEAELDSYLGGTMTTPVVACTTDNDLDDLLFRVPVLIEGDRGSGKTFTARAFAKAGGFKLLEFSGHEGVQSVDFQGHYVQTETGALVWKDGKLSEAARRAARNEKVVLLIDELQRIPTRQQSILLTTLSPDEDGFYHINTGRVINIQDGVGEEETIHCKVENLAVVATTNVGADYALDEMDPAVAERWVPIGKDTSEESLTAVLVGLADKKGFSGQTVSSAIAFFRKARKLKRDGMLLRAPTTRTLARAFELAASEDAVPGYLAKQYRLWVDRDLEGTPVKAQVDTLETVIKECFKAKAPRAKKAAK
jgi:hypothetical protein